MFATILRDPGAVSTKYLEIRVFQNLAKLGEGATLVGSRFAYKAFRHPTLSSLKQKTLEEGPLDGLYTVYYLPSLFTMLL